MKNIILFFLLLCGYASSAQVVVVPGTTPIAMPQNARAGFKLNLQIPYGQDTTLNGGPDSTAYMFYQTKDSTLYIRATKPSGQKYWMASGKITDTASLSNRIDGKVSPLNIIEGANISIVRSGNNVTINSSGGGGGTGDVSANRQTFSSVAYGATTFTTAFALPADVSRVRVYRNGFLISFTLSGNTVTIATCEGGETIVVEKI